jgi:two-component system, chemotaxis family, chemotaxis protein CheY
MPSSTRFEYMKVLIVDDCIHMRTLLRRLLGTFCIRDVDEAPNGQDGMAMLRARKYDLILTDLEMQPMDGLEFTSGVRAYKDSPNHQVPIIMISGHTAVKKVQAARDAGVTEFVVKPITTGNLLARIMDVADRPRPFMRCSSYVGPDRRRRNAENFTGPWRREDDPTG